jgi:Fe-S oxidoreductase
MGGLQGAVEMCNNNGACRKLQGGVMCPSYRVTKDEKDVTRGRANTLRLAVTGQLGVGALSSNEMQQTMKLCVSCKACKRECPTGVDMARMKIEVMAARARSHGHTLHERLVAYLPRYAPWVSRIAWLANMRNTVPGLARITESITGFTAKRRLPTWASRPFMEVVTVGSGDRDVVLLADTFNSWFEPENLRAARVVLRAAGFRVHLARISGERRLCCGRTYLATGMVEQAKIEARRTVKALLPWAKAKVPIVGLEPSCLLTLRDEYGSLIPGEETAVVASQALMLEELIMREHKAGTLDWSLQAPARNILVHGHCHQKAMGVFGAVSQTLSLIPGVNVQIIESGCCGMAGSFGYARDTADVSMKMAELDLLPSVRKVAETTLVVADGTSCRHQIADGTKRKALHVAQIMAMALQPGPNHSPEPDAGIK